MRLHPAWRSSLMIGRSVVSAVLSILILVAVWFANSHGWLATLWCVLVSIVVVGGLPLLLKLLRVSDLYVISARGVSVESGFPIRTNQMEISFRKIQVVDVRQSLPERLFLKTGNVVVGTGSESYENNEIVLRGISNPRRIAQIIRDGEDSHMRENIREAMGDTLGQPQGNPWDQPIAPQRPPMPPESNPWGDQQTGEQPNSNPWDRPTNEPNPWDR